MGKFLAALILGSAILAGGGLYYLQVYAYYDEVVPDGRQDVQMTLLTTEQAEPIPYADFQAIDSESSPIRYRACFNTSLGLDVLADTYMPYDKPVPLEAPGWFDCFDADDIATGLKDGSALAFMGQKDIEYGIDRIVAVTDNGRGYVWHQINRCGKVVFDGLPTPEDCPEPPNRN
ncbi:glycyl-tRNA synthetase subunit beta [Roseobacter sp. AzwK-3b]|uniref:DUF6446 family protein n=1 Tax=Roseobacter sp. AzwK-3b TaxID=351016 RepID=UPI0001569ACC|nr:DUF6446 family protein [Roseobacter sp. AzwK-3b]EDM71773.1 glycyl-tRNA synthetase subunit beta [Roseobacter sp. AzwK-3b]